MLIYSKKVNVDIEFSDHKRNKVKESEVFDFLQPHGLYSSWNFLGQYTGMGSLSHPLGNLSNPRIERRCPALHADS